MKRISGYCLLVLGGLHVLLGLLSGWSQVKAIVSQGVWNALGQQSQAACMNNLPCMQLNTMVWFILLGVMMMLFAAVCIWIERTLQRTIPAWIGGCLFVFSVLAVVLIPASGFWGVLAVAIYMMVADRSRSNKNA